MSMRAVASMFVLGALVGTAGAAPAPIGVRLDVPAESAGCSALAFSPDGGTIAGAFGAGTSGEIVEGKAKVTGSFGGQVVLWNAGTGRLTRTLGVHSGGATWVRFSPDGGRLATASDRDGSLRIWSPNTGKELSQLSAAKLPGALKGMLPFPALDPELHTLVTVESRVTQGKDWRYDEPLALSVWDAATGHLRWKLPNSDVYHVAFSPDGQTMAASVYHTTWKRTSNGEPQGDVTEPRLVFWVVRSGKRLQTIRLQKRAERIRYLPDGHTLAVIGSERTDFWDTHTGTVRPTPVSLPTTLPSRLRFSADGKRLGIAYVDYSAAPFRYAAEVRSVGSGKPLAGVSRTDLFFASG